jgi:hypothetical protein
MTQTQGIRIGVTVGASVLVGMHVWKPDLKIDSITIVLLIVAVLPWVQPLIKSIELLGVKLELQDLKNELNDAKGAAKSAERKADYLLSGAPPTPAPDGANLNAVDTANQSFAKLMRDYEHIRNTQSSGAARTRAMTEIVRKMVALAPAIHGFDPAEALKSDQRGLRLAAYAYLYAQPDYRFIEALVAGVTKVEDKPFGQYWGLQAISRVLASRGGASVSESVRSQLRQLSERLPRGTDRDYEVRKILLELGVMQSND